MRRAARHPPQLPLRAQGLQHNLELSELNACFGRFQLRSWTEFEARRHTAYGMLHAALRDIPELSVHPAPAGTGSPSVFPFTVRNGTAEALAGRLLRRGVEVRALMGGAITRQPAYRDVPSDGLRHCTAMADASLFVGIHQTLPLEDYVHVPFCATRCSYCNFAVDLRTDETIHARYVQAIVDQLDRLRSALPDDCTVPGIDIGGGTPTLLAPASLERLTGALGRWRGRFETPWPLSVETTPAIAALEPERLAILRAGGVDRISMGLQTAADETLTQMNRRAQLGMDERAADAISRAGFRRVNVDLVFGLPGQTLADWGADLQRVAALPIDSVTTYDCLYRGAGRGIRGVSGRPTPDALGDMYDLGYETLTARGFHASYGSVNFSRHADESGTSPYFEGRLLDGLPYLGAGNYASTLVGERWAFAPHPADEDVRAIDAGDVLPFQDAYVLPAEERWAKYILLALNFGVVDARRFRALSGGVELETAFGPQLAHAVEVGWLQPLAGESYGLAPGQFRAMPWIRALFYSRGAVQWFTRGDARGRPLLLQGPLGRAR